MNQELSPNTPLSHYRIVSKIGEGGMGEVYLAQDTKLDRKVAIKFLHEEFSKDTDKLNRFVQEAKAASALNHPNILTVHEIGEVDGKNYIATELIDGKTLREHLSYKEPQSLNTILKIGVQVSEALSAAHQAGIIHRDIKPENIMLRKDGYAKVLDFGLAKLAERRGEGATGGRGDGATRGHGDGESNTLIAASPRHPVTPSVNTTPGMIMGTVSYMSPEQARGKETDARTDIWSLGVVLYEMLAGKVPFTGETINHTIVSILEKEPLRLENLPAELQRIVRKSMTKDVDMRYQSARDLLIDLKNLRRELDLQGELERSIVPNRTATSESNENQTQIQASGSAATSRGQAAATHSVTTSSSSLEYAVTQAKSHKLATAIVVLVLLGAISTAGYFAFVSKGGAEQIKSIAVLPFANATGDKEADFLAEGIAETLINNFTRIPELRVTARSTAFRFRGREGEPKAVGSELGVGSILTGRLMQRGDNLSIQVDLINTSDGAQLWGNRYDGKISDIVTIQQRIATDVSQQLKLKLTGAQEQQIARTYNQNPEAYQYYLRGRFHWNRRTSDGMALAVAEFQKAVEKDPTYACGYVGLADAFVLEQEYGSGTSVQTLSNARAYALRALEIDPSLGEAHATLALAAHYSYQWVEAESHFKKAIELTPRYATTYQWFAGALRDAGRNAEALEMILKAKELDPLSGIIGVNAGLTHARTGDIKSAVEQLTKVIELDRSWWGGYFWLGFVELIAGKKEDALRYLEKGVELNRSSRTLGTYGFVLGVTGRKAEAIAVARELEQSYDAGGNFAVNIAAVYSGLGEKDKAFEWLEKAFADRNAEMTRLRWYPQFNPLRDDSRFKAMLKRMELPE